MRQGRIIFYPEFFIDQVNRHGMWTTQILSSCKCIILFEKNIIHSLYKSSFILIFNFAIYFHYIVHQYYRQATKNWRASKRRIHFAEGLDFIQQLNNKFEFPRKSGDWKWGQFEWTNHIDWQEKRFERKNRESPGVITLFTFWLYSRH